MKKPAVKKRSNPNGLTAKEREARRWQAREVARYINLGVEAVARGAAAPKDSDERHKAIKDSYIYWRRAGVLLSYDPCGFVPVAEKLELVTKVLKGKSIGAKYDDAYREAFQKALHTGSRMHERSPVPYRDRRDYLMLPFTHDRPDYLILPFPSEVDDKLAVVFTNRGHKKKPSKRAARRRLAQLGYGFSQKRGRRKKLSRPEITRSRGKG
jgi:hypothetical protein